jgi:kumamolisin
MARQAYDILKGSEHEHPPAHKDLNASAPGQPVTVTLILRRRGGAKALGLGDFAKPHQRPELLSRAEFAASHGADPKDIAAVETFAKSHGLDVVESDPARRSVVVRGPVSAIDAAFAVSLHDYQSPEGKYRSHTGAAGVPASLGGAVEAIVGLDDRQVNAEHFSTARRRRPAGGADDPPGTAPLTPQQVAKLYDFPSGDGAGQTIGIYEMQTGGGNAGYTVADLSATMKAFGLNFVPKPIDVSVDGVTNSGTSDGETGLDITVAAAVAPGATIAVYFTGGQAQSILHALQRMIHPSAGDPQPTVISISYGWGPDDEAAQSFSDQEYEQIDQLFQDAASLGITVLVSSGDSGAFVESKTVAETSFPASDPWVLACGGTTVGNVKGSTFDEYVWNDIGKGGPGATGGGVSARFPVPPYQSNAGLPKRLSTQQPGRGVPDIAGNASENSGYVQFINGQSQPVGGTSAVAPLYAGLIAIINANLGRPVGFVNGILYTLSAPVLRGVAGPPGPANNSYGRVAGYPATAGWNGCTGLGSLNGAAFQQALQAAAPPSPGPGPGPAPAPVGAGV